MGNKKRDIQGALPEWVQNPEVITEVEIAPHHMFTVYIVNDDYTPMDFVVEVLKRFFSMNNELATEIMLQVHIKGRAICGMFTRDVAETKVMQVNEFARRNQHPLLCQMEEN